MAESGDARLRRARSAAQLLDGATGRDPAEVARRLLGVQAQDLAWARLAFRARGVGRAAEVDRALTDERSLVLGWLMRGTLHLVAAEDYGWLLALTGPGRVTGNLRRLAQEGVPPADAERAMKIFQAAVRRDGPLTRPELAERAHHAGIRTTGQAMPHLLLYAALRGTLLAGPLHPRPPSAPACRAPTAAAPAEAEGSARAAPAGTKGTASAGAAWAGDAGVGAASEGRASAGAAAGAASAGAASAGIVSAGAGSAAAESEGAGAAAASGGVDSEGAASVGGGLVVAYVDAAAWLGEELRPLGGQEREAALGRLALRYLAGHGPATERDLATWSGLPLRDARTGLAAIATVTSRDASGLVHLTGQAAAGAPGPGGSAAVDQGRSPAGLPARLLPAYDPYMLGWRDRGFAVPEAYAKRVHPGGGTLRPVATVDGVAVATWSIRRTATGPQVALDPFAPLPPDVEAALGAEAAAVHHFETQP